MGSKFHAFLYPWFGFGHMIPYLHLANKLAEKGHMVTFLSPKKALKQVEALSLFPDNIYFYYVTLPHVDGLPVGAETTSDLPNSSKRVLADAMDLLRGQIEAEIRDLKPDLIFFDYVDWIPEMAKELGIKSVSYQIVSAAFVSMFLAPGAELGSPPPGYPSSKVALRGHDANVYSFFANTRKFLFDRVTTCLKNSDVIAIRTCAEIEGKNGKQLEDRWNNWLNGFEPCSVVYCAFATHLLFGENGYAYILCSNQRISINIVTSSNYSKTFMLTILSHQSVGCFVKHFRFGSMWETLVSDCQIVFIPQLADQFLTTRLLTEELEVSVKVERDETTGWFSKEGLRDAIKSVMDKNSEIGSLVKRNHEILKETLVNPGLLSGYADTFVEELENPIFKQCGMVD
ncbi:PREDICTED: UDP-glycosyltransferase 79B4 [Camelina sativa]|uniref:UDP-glycosyltransferase 79B4 n=1 Tax=Camelina sativa TaxID=90675 RepID=A0ABM1QFA6_CAMSA|nr:PREDICTED: UDP-glycosyltransferase 79B4 [Camelina sativa]